MKNKIAYILLMAAWVVASCSGSKDEPAAQPSPQPGLQTTPANPAAGSMWSDVPIGFSAFVEKQAVTRTDPLPIVYGRTAPTTDRGVYDESVLYGAAGTDGKGFGVYAIYTGSTPYANAASADNVERQLVMLNQQVTKANQNGSWDYTPKRFWPGNASNISFFAYAPYNATGADYPVDANVSTDATDGFTYVKAANFAAPNISWTHESQKDLLYGVANQASVDFSGQNFKVEDDDYVDMHRPNDNTLHWKLKHSLARAKFTISNYMSEAEAVAVGGSGSQFKKYLGGGTYPDPDNPSGSELNLNGYYVNRMEAGDPDEWDKYGSNTARKLIITSVTLGNVFKQGTLSLMNVNNTDNKHPLWKMPEADADKYYTGQTYQLQPTNPTVWSSVVTPENFDKQAFNELTNAIGIEPVPIHVAKDGNNAKDDTKDHYVLFIPQSENDEPITVTVKYQILAYVELVGKFTWYGSQSMAPTYIEASDPPTEYCFPSEELTLVGELPFKFEANKTYNVAIQLGKMMDILFEITDWDDTHTIDLPDFY